ncbi:hypothetical protein HCH_00927 [Hahella chejuensis KCTC 2396]|uniref:Uncharacterized protein n=1 Tax=Hahella chejuensis (strain KCTC 2396) TaxID=349521 RepID=Q2SNF7_HAHCH|nr:hypothetical protein HCH_00927 [Hahella chejuensis KCTC 2396]
MSAQKEGLCLEVNNMDEGSPNYASCMKRAKSFESMCRSRVGKDMPDMIGNKEDFRKYGMKMMDCIVPPK